MTTSPQTEQPQVDATLQLEQFGSQSGLSIHDLCIRPYYSDVESRREPVTEVQFTRRVKMSIPWVAANMQAVINTELAEAVIAKGSVPIYHRYLGYRDQVRFVKRFRDRAFVSCGVRDKRTTDKVRRLLDFGARGAVIDITHGDTKMVHDILTALKKSHPDHDVMTGNICTADAARRAIDLGADGLKVGMGPGSPCTTRVVTRVGVPQATALDEVVSIARQHGIPVCADGGINGSAESNICLALGASSLMGGKIFCRTKESALGRLEDDRRNCTDEKRCPHGLEVLYFGEASAEARSRRPKSEVTPGTVPEGEASWIPVIDTVETLLARLDGSLRSCMSLVGTRSIPEFHARIREQKLLMRTSTTYALESGTTMHL